MKRSLLILSLVLAYILFSSKGCEEDDQSIASREQKWIEKTADSIANVFSSDEPSAITLLAFEEEAKIRFSDFLDYLRIASDPGIDKVFSRQACKMIREQFISDSLFLCFVSRGAPIRIKLKIADLSEEGSAFRKSLGVVNPDSVWLSREFQRLNDTTFSGKLGYTSDTLAPSSGCLNYFPAEGNIEFFAVKRTKRFGNESLRVWSILLGKNEVFRSKGDFQ